MKLLKTLFLVFNQILFVNLVFFIEMFLGMEIHFSQLSIYPNLWIQAFILSLVVFILNLSVDLKFRNILELPNKSRVYFILMFILYTVAFALSQQNSNYFLIYAWGHLPVFYFLQNVLPNQFDLWLQFALSLFFILPSLSLKISDVLSQFIAFKFLQSSSK